jgi:hypothetical protein
VIGIEPTTLCLASTRSSQLSYTRKSEEVLVAARLSGVNQLPKVVRSTPGASHRASHFGHVQVPRELRTSRSRAASAARWALSWVML